MTSPGQYNSITITVYKTKREGMMRCISAWKMALLYSGILAILVLETPSAQAQLAAPDNLEATALKNGEIQLDWENNSQGETGFAIIADTDSSYTNQPRMRRIGGPETTTFTTPRLQGATTYWIKVRALGPSGNSDWSGASAATTPPDDLQVVTLSSEEIALRWTPNPHNNDITGYTVRYSPDRDFVLSTTYRDAGNSSAGNFHVTELLPGIKYYFEIKAEPRDNLPSIDTVFSESASATTLALPLSEGPAISDIFFGLNAWMPDRIGDVEYNGHLEEKLCGSQYMPGGDCVHDVIHESGTQIMRYGGIQVDKNYSYLLNTDGELDSFDEPLMLEEYLTMVDNIQSNGMEPLIEVPNNDNEFSASVAARLVEHLNDEEGREVKYWTIGNEPDRYDINNNAQNIATYFRSFASAMKVADPSIKITGPDLAGYDNGIMEDLTEPDGPDDITGSFNIDGQDHYYLDIINFHIYPYPKECEWVEVDEDLILFCIPQTREEIIAYPVDRLQPKLIDLKHLVDTANAEHGRTGDDAIKMAITETNVNFLNPGSYSVYDGIDDPGSDGIDGVGAMSFLGGQYWAEVFSIGMKYGLAFITPWSVVEGNELGFINNDFGTKHPSYYHFQMMATNFHGSYLEATVLNAGSNDPLIKAFGAIDVDQIVVMILNQHECGASIGAVDYTVRLDGDTVGGNNPLKINLGAGVNSEYSNPVREPLHCESTVLLVFDEAGDLQRREVYSKEWHAHRGLSPSELNSQ